MSIRKAWLVNSLLLTVAVVAVGWVGLQGITHSNEQLDSIRAQYGQTPQTESILTGPDAVFKKDAANILFAVVISVAIAMMVSIFYFKRIVDEVEEVARAVRHASKMDFSVRANVRTKDEVGFLADEINSMIERQKETEDFRDKMVKTVSHDLRTPLSVMKMGIDLILDKSAGEVTQKQKRILDTIRENVDRLIGIISDLLDVARIKTGKMRIKKCAFDVKETISDVIDLFGPKVSVNKIKLKADLPAGRLMVFADEENINRVFTNLVGNSLKYTEKGHITISAKDKGKFVEFSVADSGIGIPKQKVSSLFKEFSQGHDKGTVKEPGSGLGLFIVKEIVDIHDGRVWIESREGKGTTIFFTVSKN